MPSYRVIIPYERENASGHRETDEYEHVVDGVLDSTHAYEDTAQKLRIIYTRNEYPGWHLVETPQARCQIERLRDRELQLQAEAGAEAQRRLAEQRQQHPIHENEKSNSKRYLLIAIIFIIILAIIAFIVF